MRWLIALLVIVFGLLSVLNNELAHFTMPAVDTMPVLNVPVNMPVSDVATGPLPDAPVLRAGAVSDVERFQLALAAGFSPAQAITATALSIAEDGSGIPTVLSGTNWNGTRDLGLWQINSNWWPQFGGQDALTVPINNARAAFAIYQRQGWCAWSTFEASCGQGHNSAYRAYMTIAQCIAGGGTCQH